MFHDRKRPTAPGTLDAFRFETFFFAPWSGRGVVKDRLGFVRATYEACGKGRISDGRIYIEHKHTFSTGMIQQGEWEILESKDDGTTVARESVFDITGRGWSTERGYRWSYRAPMSTSFGIRRLSVNLLYKMVGPGEAKSTGSIGIWGLPLSTITGEFRHDEP